MADYYLDYVIGNDADPGTTAQPWRTIQRALGNATYTGAGAGDTVYCCSGAGGEPVPAPAINNANANNGNITNGAIKFIGCSRVGEVWTPGGALYYLNGAPNVATRCLAYTAASKGQWDQWRYFRFAGATAAGVYTNQATASWLSFYRCIFEINGSYGLYIDSVNPVWQLHQCVARNNTGSGFYFDGSGSGSNIVCNTRFCKVYGNGNIGVHVKGNSALTGNLIYENTGTGIQIAAAGVGPQVFGNVIHASGGDGVRLTAAVASMNFIAGNRITNNGGWGINLNTTNKQQNWIQNHNVFYGNVSGNIGPAGAEIGTFGDSIFDPAESGYVNPGEDNYNLETDAVLRRTAIDLDWDAAYG